MEEIHETAKAYYNNLTENQKDSVYKMFQSMDLNGDGSVSVSEYVEIMGKKGFKSCNNPEFFKELDKNGDGNLDFEEFMSLYYLVKTERVIFCDGHGCGAFLKGLHFTCVRCFRRQKNTFDLCSSCFNANNFGHKHETFLDNFALLRCMAAGYNNNYIKEMEGVSEAVEAGFKIAESILVISNNDGCSIL